MTTITEQLEGLLPADGNYTTKDERVIARAVAELRSLGMTRMTETAEWEDYVDVLKAQVAALEAGRDYVARLLEDDQLAIELERNVAASLSERCARAEIWLKFIAALAFAAGCIASAIYVVLA